MVGLGEEWDEVVATLRDLRTAGCQIVTIGQYLRPSLANLPMVALLHARRVRRAEAPRARAGLRPRRVRPARAQLLPRPRADAVARSSSQYRRIRSRRHHDDREARDARDEQSSSCSVSLANIVSRRDSAPAAVRQQIIPATVRAAAHLLPAHRQREARGPPPRHLLGTRRCRASAIRRRACSSSASRPQRTAPTAPGASSPATAPVGSGDFLMRAMHAHGFASIPTSQQRGRRPDAAPTPTSPPPCAARRPTTSRRPRRSPPAIRIWSPKSRRCRACAVIVALGRIAFDAAWRLLADRGIAVRPRPPFAHDARLPRIGGCTVIGVVSPEPPEHEHRPADAADDGAVFARARRASSSGLEARGSGKPSNPCSKLPEP